MSEKQCVCGHELESRGYQVLELHGESLLKDYMDVELWVCPWCGRIAFFMREKDRKDRYRAECGGRTDEELSALLESPDAPALLRDAARRIFLRPFRRQGRRQAAQKSAARVLSLPLDKSAATAYTAIHQTGIDGEETAEHRTERDAFRCKRPA